MLLSTIPVSTSLLNLVRVSFVTLFSTSFTTTLPITLGTANDFVSSGSDTGLSLFVCGNSSLTGCEYLSPANSDIVGEFEAFTTVK